MFYKFFTAFFLLAFLQSHLFAQPIKNGPVEKYAPDGNTLVYKGQFKNDIPYGSFTYYYPEGEKKAEMEFRDKGRTSYAKLYYPDGLTLMAEGKYIEQKKDSTWIFYDENGIKKSEIQFKNDLENGMGRVYYDDGSLTETAVYVNGIKNGPLKQYYPNGNLKLDATVVEGVKYDGKYTEYYENGKKLLEGTFEYGLKESSWYHFLDNGAIEIIYVYRRGNVVKEQKENGLFKEYYPDDITKSEYSWKNGKLNGPFKEYYDIGDWVTEVDTDPSGEKFKVQRLKGTQVKKEGNYKDGKLHGVVINYKENGKIASKETWENGVKLK